MHMCTIREWNKEDKNTEYTYLFKKKKDKM